ncbi:MAG TPA: diaminopropionate ammonia-lyase [Ktedonobacterales bacterium]
MPTRLLRNPNPMRALEDGGSSHDDVLAFHRRLPGYAPTPLVDAPTLAARLGVGRVWVKNESSRLGLPAFKMLGASWATYRALAARLGGSLEPWETIDELRAKVEALEPMTLAAATDGNHGRAVARMARLLGFAARIFVPAGTAAARIEGIASEGAEVAVVDGSYDDAVARAADLAGERCMVISDTAWPGYEEVPRWVIEGYSTIFAEVDGALAEAGAAGPDIVAAQIGVGALAAAVARHYRRAGVQPAPRILGVEPRHAACALASIEAGEIVTVPGPHDSIMAGLNCGTPSSVAWPDMRDGMDLFVAIEDAWPRRAMRALAEAGITAGETGSAGLAGLLALLTGDGADAARAALGATATSQVLLICTEGATDPANYARIMAGAED